MADTLTIGGLTVTPIQGSVKHGGGHDDRGGGKLPSIRAGWAYNGSCQVLIDGSTGPTLTAVIGIKSGVGMGDKDVTGAGIYAAVRSYDALVDVELTGDAVQIANISWKGTASAGEATP
jgi:hypothetical protein